MDSLQSFGVPAFLPGDLLLGLQFGDVAQAYEKPPVPVTVVVEVPADKCGHGQRVAALAQDVEHRLLLAVGDPFPCVDLRAPLRVFGELLGRHEVLHRVSDQLLGLPPEDLGDARGCPHDDACGIGAVGHVGGRLGETAILPFGPFKRPDPFLPVGDVPPGVHDAVPEPDAADVEVPLLSATKLQGVDVVIEDKWHTGLNHRAVLLHKACGQMAGQQIQQAGADELRVGKTVVLAGSRVRVRVFEVDDLARGVPNRGQHDVRVQQTVERGAQPNGRINRVAGSHASSIGSPYAECECRYSVTLILNSSASPPSVSIRVTVASPTPTASPPGLNVAPSRSPPCSTVTTASLSLEICHWPGLSPTLKFRNRPTVASTSVCDGSTMMGPIMLASGLAVAAGEVAAGLSVVSLDEHPARANRAAAPAAANAVFMAPMLRSGKDISPRSGQWSRCVNAAAGTHALALR